MNIRNATLEDMPDLLRLGQEFHSEFHFSRFNYDPEKIRELVTTLIAVDAGIMLVAEEDYEIHGAFAGALSPMWFGNDLVATDYALFLSPEHRGNFTAPQLVKEYVKQAKEKGAKQIFIGTSTGYESEKLAKFFERMGGTRRGYIYEL